MADMGLDFKAPKQNDIKRWRMAKELWTIGETFHSCGCSGPGYRPREPAALRTFLVARRRHYLASYRHFLQRAEDRSAVEYWRERLARIEAAMQRAGVEAG